MVVVGEREGMLARGWIGSVCVYVYGMYECGMWYAIKLDYRMDDVGVPVLRL